MKIGSIGFIDRPGNVTALGIEWFSRWQMVPGFKAVDHTFMVTGTDEVTEEHIGTGCAVAPLSGYLNDPHTVVYFRTPVGMTDDMAETLVKTIKTHLGAKYATATIAADLLDGTIAGHYLNDIFKNAPEHWLNRALAQPGQYVCSGLVASALDALPEYHGKGCLAHGYYSVEPEDLFCDPVLFEPGYEVWIQLPRVVTQS